MSVRASQAISAGALGRRLLRALPAAWALAATGLLFRLFHASAYDDPYITYRYAANLARGAGLVYNAGERVLSTTTPLYALILSAAGLAGADIPLASNLIACASLGLGGLAFWHLGRAWRMPVAGVVGMLLYPLFPLLTSSIGGEAPLYLALILFGLLAYVQGRYTIAAGLLALGALTRFDGVLAAAICGGHFLLARRRPIPWRALAVYGALLAPWLLFATAYFGAPLPVTLEAKRRQGLLPISEGFLPGLLRLAREQYLRFPIYWPHFVLAAVGLLYGLARWRRPGAERAGWLLICAWSAAYALAYTALGVTSYFWYYTPIVPGFVTLIGLGAQVAAAGVRRYAGPGWAGALAGAMALALLYPQAATLRYQVRHPDARAAIYRAAGEWLRERTPAGASVGAIEVGIIGYYAERRMVDFAGLIEPDVALRLTPATSYDDAALWAADRYRPEYLVLRPGALPRLQGEWAPSHGCRAVQTLSDPAYEGSLVIYKCAS